MIYEAIGELVLFFGLSPQIIGQLNWMHSYTEEITQFSDKSTHIDKTNYINICFLGYWFWYFKNIFIKSMLDAACYTLNTIIFFFILFHFLFCFSILCLSNIQGNLYLFLKLTANLWDLDILAWTTGWIKSVCCSLKAFF